MTTTAPPLIALANRDDRDEWDRYVAAHPDATAYHLAAWQDVIEQSFGHRTFYLMARRGSRLVGVLPLVLIRSRLFSRCLVSLPFLDYGGVLAEDAVSERVLTDEAIRIARQTGVAHVELRHSRSRNLGLVTRNHKVSMRLELPGDAQQLWTRFASKLRSQIRRAQKVGFAARFGGQDELDAFYAVFAENMRDLGTPVHSKRFFARILERFPGTATICTTREGERPVAAGFLFRFGAEMQVQWASSLKRFNPSSPNMLLYWAMLEHACQSGMRSFDFGRSTPGSGTYRFKEQWGARPLPLCWDYWLDDGGELPDLNYANPKYAVAVRLWRRLPLTVANILGPRIIKYVPA